MKKFLSIIFAVTGWFSVITQYLLMMEHRAIPAIELTIRFFSYFTILTNALLAFYFTFQVFRPSEKFSGSDLNRPGSLTAITVYITTVGLIYQIALRQIWNPEGLQMVVDELLHSVIPVLTIIYWALYEKKSLVRWKSIPKWLIYPGVYLVYILIRGGFSGFYPYPFIDVSQLGWKQALINIALLTGVFIFLSYLFIGLGKWISHSLTVTD